MSKLKFSPSILSFLFVCVFLLLKLSDASAAAPQVFYQTQESDKCVWNLMNLETNKITSVLNLFKKCSPNVFIHKSKKGGYALVDNVVYKFSLGENPKIEKLANTPQLGSLITPVVTAGGVFRIGHVIPVSENDVITKEKENKTYYRYKGKLYLDDNPPMGSPAVAEVLELKKDKFETIHITSTQFESEGAPGIFVVLNKLESSPDYTSLPQKIKDGQCSEQDCTELKGWNTKTKKNIKKTLGLDKEEEDPSSDEPGFVSSGGAGRGLAARVIWGDTAHYSPPVYFCDQFCEKSNEVDGVELQQLSITPFEKDYFLVAEEYSNNEALILKHGSKTPFKILQKSLHAVWASDLF